MKKSKKTSEATTTKGLPLLPKDALSRINLGQSFAEYDTILRQPNIFVLTPALQSALDPSRGKLFYVGRRGTGKTAITIYLDAKYQSNSLPILPQLFAYVGPNLDVEELLDTRQRPFKSRGESHASSYEDIVGDVIRLCFFRSLTNVEPKVRDVDGRVVRDWIAANRSTSGF